MLQQHYQDNNSFSFEDPINDDSNILKRKDPKQMSMSELDEYINKNKPQLLQQQHQQQQQYQQQHQKQQQPQPPLEITTHKQSQYIQELESKISFLQSQNSELQSNYRALTSLLEKERAEFQSRLMKTVNDSEKKIYEDNKTLLKQIEDLKLQNSLQQTNMSILTSEKERHIEQNAIDKEYYENQILNLQKENELLKKEMKEKTKNFSNIISQQQYSMEQDIKLQIKNYKDMLTRSEKDKKDIIKKYENKIHEMQVKINRLERNEHKSRSKSKGKYTNTNANMSLTYNYSPLSSNRNRLKSKSRSKSKGKIKTQNALNASATSYKSNCNKCNCSNADSDVFFTLRPNNDAQMQMSNSGSFANYGCLTSINDAIFSLERNIADLNHNYKSTVDKLNRNIGQEESNTLNRNLMVIQNDIDEQNEQLNVLKQKQQEYLKQGFTS